MSDNTDVTTGNENLEPKNLANTQESELETKSHEDTPIIQDEDEIISSDELEYGDEEEQDEEEIDYSNLSDNELLNNFADLIKTEDIPSIKDKVQALRDEFNSRFDEDLKEQKETFLEEGGNIIDFKYSTPVKKKFNNILFDYREKRNNYYQSLKRNLHANLKKREAIIEELKGLLNLEENISSTYQQFKNLQDQWHTAGPIPRDAYNITWNTYRHHVENFYDFLHLNREFRDLDFKNNLEQKLKLIQRAEELVNQDYSNKVFRELQMLHKMWKEDVGPVAKEYREDIWTKFSDLSKNINKKRQEYLKEQEQVHNTNLEKKLEVIATIQNITEKTKPNHNAWQEAIKKVEEQRQVFFKIGKVPYQKNKEIWNSFKNATRLFNRTKNSFYKNQKKEQLSNLEKKRELINIAIQHKDSDDFDVVTPLMKKIQSDWKSIGHVPRKHSDRIWKEFKNACNHYFDRIHKERNKASEAEVQNLAEKQALIELVKAYKLTEDKNEALEEIKSFLDKWNAIGRVPRNKRNIANSFNSALDRLFKQLDLNKNTTELLKYDTRLQGLDNHKLRNEHFFVSKKIDETKEAIMQLENNLGFFQNVDSNNPLVKDVRNKIKRHKVDLELWKAKLEKIKEARKI